MPRVPRFLFVLLALLPLLATPARAGDAADYFAPRAGMDVDTALYLDAWSGKSIEALRARLNKSPAPANAADGWSLLCDFEWHSGDYARATPDCEKAVALDPKGDDANTLAIVQLVANEPAPRAFGFAKVPMSPDAHISVHAAGYDGTAIADTGAEISVMMQSVAQAAHVRMLGASKDVGTTTASISGQIGLLPEFIIGHAIIRNTPVLVLPDAQLTITDGKTVVKLPFIIGLYAMAQFGRVAWLDHGKVLALGSAAPQDFPDAVPMTWHPLGIAVPLDGPGGRRAAHFDSGADASYLFDAALPLLSDAERAQIVEGKRKIGGAGGVVEETVRKLPVASFALAGQPFVLANVVVAAAPPTGEAARIGEDMLKRYAAVVLDFRTMEFSLAP
jgi:hypothetical protein